jgi:hypothetical protein
VSLLLTEEKIGTKPMLYLISWAIRILFEIGLSIGENFRVLSVSFLKMVRIHRKLHFVVMNMAIIDIFYYGTRNLVHTNYNGAKWDIILSSLAFTFAVFDIFNIGYVCASTGLLPSTKKDEKSDKKRKLRKRSSTSNSSLSESKFSLKEHEKDKKHFKMLKKGDFGLRQVFWDSDIDKYGFTTRDQLRRIGYKKVISYE